MKRKGFDIYIGKRGAIAYLETIDETNPLVADTYAYDKPSTNMAMVQK